MNPGPRAVHPHACGELLGMFACPVTDSVHPHACGELISHTFSICLSVGSSPRMWGTHMPPHIKRLAHRFIPTHVGNSCAPSVGNNTISVHPHACGELGRVLRVGCVHRGSSPRMWGTHRWTTKNDTTHRFIPTHVGNSNGYPATVAGPSVHPHACGELSRPGGAYLTPPGSSPRMWGTLVPTQGTGVGSTGSSPRMWGTRRGCAEQDWTGRFIPTHVGNSGQPGPPAGSSPRMWGTLFNFYIKTRKITSGDLRNF